jgi:hypothetical protein
VCLSVYPPVVSRQWLGEHVPAAKKIIGVVVFYTVRVLSKDNRRLVLLIISR